MHLKKTKRGERVYLSVVQNYREGGKTKTKTIESIGYVDQFTSQYADPIAHFQAYVAELNERAKSENPPIAFTFPRDATIDPYCPSSLGKRHRARIPRCARRSALLRKSRGTCRLSRACGPHF